MGTRDSAERRRPARTPRRIGGGLDRTGDSLNTEGVLGRGDPDRFARLLPQFAHGGELGVDLLIQVRTPGGGGHGKPQERAREAIERDVRRGYYGRQQ